MYIYTYVYSHGYVSFCVFVCIHVPHMHKAGARGAVSYKLQRMFTAILHLIDI